MHDAVLMRGGDGVGHRRDDREEPLERKAALGHQVGEGSPFDEGHGDEVGVVGFFDGVNRDDRRMIEAGERPRFAFESGAAFGVIRSASGQDLEGDLTAEFQVAGAVDLAHPAFAELGPRICTNRAGCRSSEPCAGEYRRGGHRSRAEGGRAAAIGGGREGVRS